VSATRFTARAPLRVLIVDDEPLARQRIEHLLEAEPDVTVIRTAATGDEAVQAIRETSPDVVFLDVQMPGRTGLDVVRDVGPDFMPVTVFVTAHDDYAVKAFELAAADYLLKPYSDERFEEAMRRARERVEVEDLGTLREQLRVVLETDTASRGADPGESRYLERIAVQSRGRLRVVPIDRVDHIEASGVYAEIHVGSDRHLVRTSLSTLEQHLNPDVFFRVHRSAIVRLDEVELLIREGGGSCCVQLRSGTKLPVSRSRREELEVRLGRI
jgi:two-component system, LytTR family, response regulator